MAIWTPDDIRRIGSADELQIAAKRTDGTLRRWLPIWVVCIGEHVYVRTWYRRNTGWWQLQPQPRPFGSTRSAAEPAPYRSPGSPSSEVEQGIRFSATCFIALGPWPGQASV